MVSFKGNVAHSMQNGIQFESQNFDGDDNPKVAEGPLANYNPRDSNGIVQTIIDEFRAYKISFRGIWARVDDFVVANSHFSDCFEGVQLATSGAHPMAPSIQKIDKCLFVGKSGNQGMKMAGNSQGWDGQLNASFPMQGDGFTGWKLYDGTAVMTDCTFREYPDATSGKKHSAIGIRRGNHGQMATTTYIATSTFDNVVRPVYFLDNWSDGGKVSNILDKDGSISGYQSAMILEDSGYSWDTSCIRPDTGSYIVCPQKHNQMWIMDMDHSNTDNSLLITRNQHIGNAHTNYTLSLDGFGDWGIWRYQPAVAVGASYLIEFRNFVTQNLAFEMTNGEKDESVDFAVCYPLGTVIKQVFVGLGNKNGQAGPLSAKNAENASLAINRESVDGDSYFWDENRGMLFLSVKQKKERENYGNFCPDEGCNFVWIRAVVPDGAVPRRCIDTAYSGDNSIQETSGYFFNQKLTPAQKSRDAKLRRVNIQ